METEANADEATRDAAYGAINPSYRVSDSPWLRLPENMKNWPPIVPPEPCEATGIEDLTATELCNLVTGETIHIPSGNQIQQSAMSDLSSTPPYQGLLPQGFVPESVFPPDDRVRVSPTTSFPWRTICKLYITFPDGTSGGGSGAIIDGYHILTAGHCVYHHSYGGWATSIKVVPGLDDSYMPYNYAWAINARTYTGWTVDRDTKHDWAVLTLDRNIGNYTGWMGRMTALWLNSVYTGILNTAGYPGDQGGLTMWFDGDNGRTASEYNHWYYMDTFGGQSGSPVWVYYSEDERYILTVHTSGDDGSGSNHGTRLNQDKYDRIITWCNEDVPPTDKADLIDDGETWSGFSPTTIRTGDWFEVWCDVRNVGTASSGGFYVSYYASTNTTITEYDYLIGTDYVSSISPFDWANSSWSNSFPSSIPNGAYYVGWIIDSESDVSEFDEGNNTAYKSSYVLIVESNTQPQLSNGDVDPNSGDTSTIFSYYVDYYDADGDAPTIKYVYIDGTPHTMSLYSGSSSNGTYVYSQTLSDGNHSYYFSFSDGEDTVRLPPSGSYSGPSVSSSAEYEVNFLEPHDGDTVKPNENGTVLIRAEYIGSDCPYYLDIYIDGIRKAHIRSYSQCTTSASYYWPTFEYSDGYHSLYACVTYQDGTLIAESETIQVHLDNPESPQIQITNPASNETVSGLVDITAKVITDPAFAYSINKVGFYVDGSNIGWVFDPSGQENSYTFYYTLYNWDSVSVSDGQHTILARVYDQYDRTAEHSIVVIVQQAPPTSVQFETYYMYDGIYGNNDGIANPGELLELYICLENTGTQTAYEVTATAATISPYINYSCAYPPHLASSFGDIPAGETRAGYMYFMVSNAPDGTSIVFDLTITDSSNNTWYDSFELIITGTDTLPPRAVTLKVSPQILNVGNIVTIMAFVEEGDDMSSGYVTAQIETSNKALATTIVLYDDGLHNDLNAGDGVFGGSWITTLPETDYFVSILTSDNSGNSAEWTGLAGFSTKTFTVSNKILVVDDDNHNLNAWATAAPYQYYYTAALDANGLAHDVWECFFRGSPHSSILLQYDAVIWLTGDTYGEFYFTEELHFTQGYYAETLSSTDQSNLMTYLEGGGTLFICGQDIGYDLFLGNSDDKLFYANYLHAVFVQDYVDLFGLNGATGDPMTDGLYLTISGGDGADNQYYASEIDPINGAVTIFTYDLSATQTLQRSSLQRDRGFLEKEQEMQPLANQLPQGTMSSGSGAISVDTGTYKVVYFAFGFEAIDNPADRNIIMRKVTHWLQGTAEGSLPQLFNTNSYLVVGDDAYCTDVLGTAKISYGLALGGASQNPEGRTHTILTTTEHTTGNLAIVGGPAINPVADEFDTTFGITYTHNPGISFEIFYGGESIYLDLTQYPNEDICIIYLGENSSRNIMLVWGYGWRGTYAGSAFMGDPSNWQEYEGTNMLMLRWTDSNADGLVQMSEITVESYEQPSTAKMVIRGVVNWLRGTADWVLSLLFNTNSYLVVGDDAYCTDVLGTAKISYGLALGGASQNPEGRTHTILTTTEHTTGNLAIVGGPAINPVADEFDTTFGITYNHNPGISFQINAEGESINLNLQNYPQEDICIVYLDEHNGRNVLLVWGYGWYGTYAGSVFAGDPEIWKTYPGAHLFMLRWIDSNGDGLVQKTEIFVTAFT